MDWESEFFERDRGIHPPAFTPEYKTSVLRSPRQPPLSLQNSLSEVTGPLFGGSELGQLDNDLILNYAKDGQPIGERIIVHGQVKDGSGRPVPNILVEFWQANAGGRYRHRNDRYIAPIDPNFGGCGRTISNANGEYRFRTVKPGPYPFRNFLNSWRPAHIHFSVFGTGFVQRLITQMYFEGDPLLSKDVMFTMIPDEAAARRLVASIDSTRWCRSTRWRTDSISFYVAGARHGSRTSCKGTSHAPAARLSRRNSVADGRSLRAHRSDSEAGGLRHLREGFGHVLIGPSTEGTRIKIEGRVIDGAGAPLKDALIEIWQANAAGRYNHPADRQSKALDAEFRGWGRAGCDFESGLYSFETVKPGSAVGRRGHRPMAPHINFWIIARGINIGLNTRMYFSDEEAANAADPVLNLIESEIRRRTLIAPREQRGTEVVYRFDIYLQGDRETVFFDV